MAIPAANIIYDVSNRPIIAQGLRYSDNQVQDLLEGPVKEILEDTKGTADLHGLIGSVITTDFEHTGLEKMLQHDTGLDNWRVGEAIAEAFISSVGPGSFPWPTGRDLKNPNASPAGCDLTGFQHVSDDECPFRFAFGEVKTSVQEKSPPSVMSSLNKQLLGLRDHRSTKDALCRYLGHHAQGSDWMEMYLSAAKRYLGSGCSDVAIYGVLLRDVAPQKKDIVGCVNSLSDNCPSMTDIEVYALYLPLKCIETLSGRAIAIFEKGGGA